MLIRDEFFTGITKMEIIRAVAHWNAIFFKLSREVRQPGLLEKNHDKENFWERLKQDVHKLDISLTYLDTFYTCA